MIGLRRRAVNTATIEKNNARRFWTMTNNVGTTKRDAKPQLHCSTMIRRSALSDVAVRSIFFNLLTGYISYTRTVSRDNDVLYRSFVSGWCAALASDRGIRKQRINIHRRALRIICAPGTKRIILTIIYGRSFRTEREDKDKSRSTSERNNRR